MSLIKKNYVWNSTNFSDFNANLPYESSQNFLFHILYYLYSTCEWSMIWEKRKFWLDLYGRFARRVLPKRSSTVLLPELFVCVFFLYQTFTMSTIWWTWKSASNVSRLQKNASVSVRTKCNISQSRWMSFLKVCVHYYVFYEGILYNISMICFRKNVLFF